MAIRALLVCMFLAPGIACAGELSMDPAAFRQLPEAEQREVLSKALRQRADILSNTHYRVDTVVFLAPYVQQELGKPAKRSYRFEQEYWKLGDSYRLNHAAFDWEEPKPQEWSDASFDAEKGVTRALYEDSQSRDLKGSIYGEHSSVTKLNEYARFLPGTISSIRTSHLQNLVDNIDNVELLKPSEHGDIALRIVDKLSLNRTELNTYWLAPERDFSIIRWERRKIWPDGKRFQNVDLWVTEHVETDNLWMPKRLLQVSWTDTTNLARAGVTELTLQEMKIGGVKPADLEIVFPKGITVSDTINGTKYIVGEQKR